MKLTRSLKVALVVMVTLGTLFVAAPGYAWRGHPYWHGGWGWGPYGERTTLITGIATLTTLTTTPIIVTTVTPIIRTDIGGRQGSVSISDDSDSQRGGNAW